MPILAQLRRQNILRDIEWNPDDVLTLSFRGNELAGEVGELCNLLKKVERERLGLVGSRASREQLPEELADIIICVDMIAMALNINLAEAIVEKFNKTSRERGLSVLMESDS